MTYIITVDPGISGTGIATWAPDRLAPVYTKSIIIPEPREDWVERMRLMSEEFYQTLKAQQESISKVYIEYPKLMQTASGMASAQRGDVFKLMCFVGVLAAQCWRYNTEFIPLPVNDWKGVLPKGVVAQRVAARLKCSARAYPNHVMDAVGMGLYLKGEFDGSGITRPAR